jgi:aminopeptidase N
MPDYRFSRADFGALPLAPLHYDLFFDVRATRVRVVSRQTYICNAEDGLSRLELNAHDLKVGKVQIFSTHSVLGPPPVGIDAVVPDFVAHVASLSDPVDAAFTVDAENRKLYVELTAPLSKGAEIAIRVESTCVPTANVLEGIYFDSTPTGAPQTMITQCQQYGFQRIVPCVDRMASKTFYTTTIVASIRYSNMISTGDLAPGFVDAATGETAYGPISEDVLSPSQMAFLAASPPCEDDEDARHVVRYHNHTVNMAPYLFFLGLGSYDVYKRAVEYPDTGDTFDLELLCIPGVVEPRHAEASLTALHDSILWLFMDGGPEKYDHVEERKRVYALMDERETIKAKAAPLVRQSLWSKEGGSSSDAVSVDVQEPSPADAARLSEVRAELASLLSQWKETGYRYTGTVYREIAMENSNYGGMENVGNTTIISGRLTPSAWLVDGGYLYMEGVKIHEYYHNINGSQVTGQSPFEIWLNEAVTVHVQREREDELFGADYMRLRKVIYAFQPATGPLAVDRSPTSMAVEPRGFNTTHELISAMTYSKAPAFVRMVQRILGKKAFVRALENYHQRFAYSNARTADWIACMAEQAPDAIDLPKMAEGWLRRTGYPTITCDSVAHDPAAQTLTLTLSQTGFETQAEEANRYPWTVPLDWSCVTDGTVTHEGLCIFDTASTTITIEAVPKMPDFVSLARGWSFFGDVKFAPEAMTDAQRVQQAMTDPDAVNRYLAYSGLADAEKARLIEAAVAGGGQTVEVSPVFLELFGKVLTDRTLSPATRALFLNIHESIPSRNDLGHLYVEISNARLALLQAVYDAHAPVVLDAYRELLEASKVKQGAPQKEGLMERPLLYVCYSVLHAGAYVPSVNPSRPLGGNTHAGLTLTLLDDLRGLLTSTAMSDRFFALRAVLQLQPAVPGVTDDVKADVLAAAKAEWTKHPIGCEQYVQAISCVDCDDTPRYIKELVEEPFFDINLAGHARTVARGWSSNRKRCLLTDAGLKLTEELFIKIGSVNQMSAYSFLSAFGDLRKFDDARQATLVAALERMKESADGLESLRNQLTILLKK